MASYFVYLAVLVVSIHSALSLKCYNCDTSKGLGCGYSFLSFTYDTVECDGSFINPPRCVKIVAEDKNGNEYIARNCTSYAGALVCKAVAEVLGFAQTQDVKKMECFSCDDDKCNSASRFSGMAAIGLVFACIAFLF